MKRQTSQISWEKIKTSMQLITAGGSWSAQFPDQVQHNLRMFFFDGVFAASQDAIHVTYLTLYVLALGATKAQIGLMSALGSIGAMLLLLPGAILAEKLPSRKWLVVWTGGGISRLMLLGFAILPFFLSGEPAVVIAIAMKVVMDGFGNLSMPAWTSLTADIVPLAWRGRYFGTRNMFMGIANMLVTFIAGQIIVLSMTPVVGYQRVYFIALMFGIASSVFFASIREPRSGQMVSQSSLEVYKPGVLLQGLKQDRNFLAFCISQMVWNFSVNIAGPFFSVYQVEVLNSTAAIIGIQSIIASVAGLPAQRLFGALNDRWGARKVLLLTGFLIPFMPFVWLFVRSPWHPTPINIWAGFMWAGYNLATFNFLLALSTPQTRARYSALYQIAVTLSLAAGSAFGGFLVQHVGYPAIFISSGLGRFLSVFLLWRFVKAPEEHALSASSLLVVEESSGDFDHFDKDNNTCEDDSKNL
ncbi:MFS transporter [Anaerolinea thermophila]|nr:MFS transporter [Anaerolinea thermophila]